MEAAVRTAPVVYWHGGAPHLKIGTALLPPSITGARGTLYEAAINAGLPTPATPHEVYVTTVYAAALMYAVVHPAGGHIYTVEPVGELRPDADCSQPGLSFVCDSAIIYARTTPTARERRAVFRALGIPEVTSVERVMRQRRRANGH